MNFSPGFGKRLRLLALAFAMVFPALSARAQDVCATATNPVHPKELVSKTSLSLADDPLGTKISVSACVRYATTDFPFYQADVMAMVFNRHGRLVQVLGQQTPIAASIPPAGSVSAPSAGAPFGADYATGYRLDSAQIARQVLFRVRMTGCSGSDPATCSGAKRDFLWAANASSSGSLGQTPALFEHRGCGPSLPPQHRVWFGDALMWVVDDAQHGMTQISAYGCLRLRNKSIPYYWARMSVIFSDLSGHVIQSEGQELGFIQPYKPSIGGDKVTVIEHRTDGVQPFGIGIRVGPPTIDHARISNRVTLVLDLQACTHNDRRTCSDKPERFSATVDACFAIQNPAHPNLAHCPSPARRP
jgi:hypothetical protein